MQIKLINQLINFSKKVVDNKRKDILKKSEKILWGVYITSSHYLSV